LPPLTALFLVLFIAAFDQLAKYYVTSAMNLGESIPVIDGVFHFTYVLNPGAAFGIMKNQTAFFVIIAVIVLAGSMYFFSSLAGEARLARFGVILLAGGAAGNLIDRVKTGFVIDFFDFRVWPVFNIADLAIVIGASLIALALWLAPSDVFSKNTGGD
jgi:signal peptidase II